MLFLAETKIDDQFPDAQFQVNNYHFWRADRTAYGGGIAAYVRSDLPKLCIWELVVNFGFSQE
jgi:exonuclease III